MTRVVVVRHGETDWNKNGRMQGWAPVPLNETGRQQARAVGEFLAKEYDIDRVFSSDSVRTRQTADRLLEGVGEVPIEFEPHWRERDLGVYQGLTYADVEERFPEFGLGEAAYEASLRIPEGGESLRDVADRVTNRFRSVVDAHDAETLLVVTHGGPIHVLLGYAKGMDLEEALGSHHQANCGVNEIRADDELDVVRENVTEWDS